MLNHIVSNNPTPNTTQAKSNVPSFEDYRKIAKDLGTQRGQGRDTQIKFALQLVEGAYLGALNLDPNKHGTGIDDAEVLSKDYLMMNNAAAIFDVKADNIRKLVSNHRKCLKVGGNPKWGRGQPMAFVQEFVSHYTNLRKVPGNVKKMDDIFNALMRLFTAQLKENTLLPDAERNAFVWKTEKEPKTEVEKLEAARKMLAKSGDSSAQIQAAMHSITQRLANIAKGIK